MEPIMLQLNWRVEVNYKNCMLYCRNERDAKYLADYVKQLKDIDAFPVCDVEYKCANCGFVASTEKSLKGCCEENK